MRTPAGLYPTEDDAVAAVLRRFWADEAGPLAVVQVRRLGATVPLGYRVEPAEARPCCRVCWPWLFVPVLVYRSAATAVCPWLADAEASGAPAGNHSGRGGKAMYVYRMPAESGVWRE